MSTDVKPSSGNLGFGTRNGFTSIEENYEGRSLANALRQNSELENSQKFSENDNYSSPRGKGCLRRGTSRLTISESAPQIMETGELSFYSQDSDRPTLIRKDSFGNEILYGSKKHKITFSRKICTINEVESYKQYNVDEERELDKAKHGGGMECWCRIM